MTVARWIIFVFWFINVSADFSNTTSSTTVNNVTEDDVHLLFVQMLWRHGDRASLHELYPIYEQDWIFGGGGFGELTSLGMAQMNRLGIMTREKYVTEKRFLEEKYKSREIYIRSTDMNRTIVSAMSFLYGFNPPGPWNVENIDYPTSPGWLTPMTFIPIHVDNPNNCVSNVGCPCPRYKELQAIEHNLPEWENFVNGYKQFLGGVMKNYNFTSPTDIPFLYFPDSIKCMRNHFNETLYEKCPWFNEEFYTTSQKYSGGLKRMIEGVFENETMLNGIDIGKEIRTLQGGPVLNELYDRAAQKYECMKTNCSGYFRDLKFYAYSSHDQILYLILALFGIPDVTESLDSWPHVSASINFEFYNSKNSDEYYFKLLYRKGDGEEMKPVTHLIEGCDGNDICQMRVFQRFAEFYEPSPDITTRCAQLLSSSRSSMHNQFIYFTFFSFLNIFYLNTSY